MSIVLHKGNLWYVPINIIGSLGYDHAPINAIKASPNFAQGDNTIEPYNILEKNKSNF